MSGTGSLTQQPEVLEVTVTDFEYFFRLHYGPIFQQVAWVIGDRARAAEVTQEAFIRAYLKWRSVSKMDRPAAWVRIVAIRLGARAKQRDAKVQPTDTLPDVAAQPIDQQLKLDVEWAIALLPPNQRAAVLLYYFEDMPVVDVAHALRCRQGTVKAHLHRAREALAQSLAERGYH